LSPSPARSGFTLIEVLVTLVILSVGLVMVLRALDTSVVALDEARYAVVAERTIREKMSEVESLAGEGGTFALQSAGGRFATDDGFVGEMMVEGVEGSVNAGGKRGTEGQLFRVTVALERKVFKTRYAASTYMWVNVTDKPEEEAQ